MPDRDSLSPGRVLRAVLLLAALAAPPFAQALVLAVNEGVSYRVPNEEIRAKFAAIGAGLSKLLQQPVTIEPVGDYTSLRAGLASHTYDLALVHPAHVSIQAMNKSGYRLVAVTKGYTDYRASFMVNADSPLKTLADLNGQRLGAPDEDSITAWMVRAALRDAKVDPKGVKFSYTRYQDAVPFFVQNNLTNAGASASAGVVKKWTTGGGRLLGQSKPVPIKHVIAAPSLSAEQVDAVRQYLTTLDASEDGRKALEPTHYIGFATYDQAAMLDLGRWLGL